MECNFEVLCSTHGMQTQTNVKSRTTYTQTCRIKIYITSISCIIISLKTQNLFHSIMDSATTYLCTKVHVCVYIAGQKHRSVEGEGVTWPHSLSACTSSSTPQVLDTLPQCLVPHMSQLCKTN